MKLRSITLGLFLFIGFFVNAQNEKFGKVSKEELLETKYEKDSTAAAVVLYRKESTKFNYIQSTGFQVVRSIQERVKIYDKSGFKYATVTERLYKNSSANESVSGLKAYTYNLENGEIIKVKLKNSDTFSESVSKYRNEEKFTMPNIKEGCVIEYEYDIISPFFSIDDVVLQYDIPIKKQDISISIPEYYSFKTNMKGYLRVVPKYEVENGKITFNHKQRSGTTVTQTSFSTSNLDYRKNKTIYQMIDVPALKEEPFVNSMNNYRSAVSYELQYIEYPQSLRKSYTTTWGKVVKTIYDSDNFGKQLGYTNYFKEDINTLLNGVSSNEEKLVRVFSHVQQHMNWNNYRGKYTDQGVKKAYKEKTGNVADINLMLVAMLREVGLESNPVLVSTRDNGVPLFPTSEGFNYVVASAEINGQIILMDACNKYTRPNLLPTQTLNWYGRIIKKDGTSTTIPMFPKKLSKETQMMQISLKENGNLEGKIRKSYTDYKAYAFRNKNNGTAEDDYLEKLENKSSEMEISNYEVNNKGVVGKPIMGKFDFIMENQADVIGDKIYFSPLFFNATTENPFKLEERNFPIDFTYPWQEKYIINIDIPEGYKIESKPENIAIALQDNMGSFSAKILEQGGNKLQVMVDLKVNSAVIPAHNYAGVKEFYKKVVEKETEKVVLSKI